MRRIAGIATVNGRQESLVDTINSLHNQVDEVLVYNGDIEGDKVKFTAYRKDCFYFSCDDDLIYPPDYCDKMIEAYHRNNKAIITNHGRIFSPPITDYYKNGTKFHCLHEVKEDVQVHCGGTGVMMFTGQMDISLDMFKIKNMADIWIALLARKNKVPIICMKHDKDWIQHTTKIDLNKTIHAMHVHDCVIQTGIINSVQW